jgi:hypothetical protein
LTTGAAGWKRIPLWRGRNEAGAASIAISDPRFGDRGLAES